MAESIVSQSFIGVGNSIRCVFMQSFIQMPMKHDSTKTFYLPEEYSSALWINLAVTLPTLPAVNSNLSIMSTSISKNGKSGLHLKDIGTVTVRIYFNESNIKCELFQSDHTENEMLICDALIFY